MLISLVLYAGAVHLRQLIRPARPRAGRPRHDLPNPLASRFVLCLGVVVASILVAWVAAPAGATIPAPTVLDGPSSSILDIDGAAMAPDGTGGVVYRKLAGGEPHVFVSRVVNGVWQAPIQVDTGQLGPATVPRIAAADGGELLVVWVQPWMWISSSPGAQATLHYELMSAVLQPGAQSFGQIERIDDVGDGTAAYPSLAMAPDGSAYVAYRVVTNSLTSNVIPIQPMRPGDEIVEVRVQRFNGLSWSSLGAMNRLLGQVTMRRPTASNGPVVAVNDAGEALVVWQEPAIDGVAQIWARRLSGTTKGNVLEVSPSSIAGKQVSAEAEAPALALSEYGEAKVAFRLAGGAGSPLGSPHVLLNTLTLPVAEEVSTFAGAVPIDGAAAIGVPSVAIDAAGEYRLAYTAAGASRLLTGKETTNGAPATLGGVAGGEQALTTIDPGGGGVSAWPATGAAGLPVVEARQDFPGATQQTAELSAPLSGPITGLVAGQSGLGDELIAFDQGPPGAGQIVASLAKSPPGKFSIHVPLGWLNAKAAVVEWEPATNAIGALTYSVLLDGRLVAHGLPGFSYKFNPNQLGDGVRHIQVIAVDDVGQQTLSAAATLHAETNPPLVSVKYLSHKRVRVRVYGDAAGIKAADTLVSFGDGATSKRHDNVVHAYRRPGRYTIIVHATDKVGNYRDAHVLVRVR
jgi:hypothetical protein